METTTFKYIEVKTFKTAEVVKRLDVSGKSEKSIDRIDDGLNINLNHEKFYTSITESNTKLNTI
jgi:hypothetical protein